MVKLDLFGLRPSEPKRSDVKPKRRVRTPRSRSWTDFLPWTTTARGVSYSDPARTEAMLSALLGEGEWDALASRLAERVADELNCGRLCVRAFPMREEAPARFPDGRVEARRAQRARIVLRTYRRRLWQTTVSERAREPFHHGAVTFSRAFMLAWPGGTRKAKWDPATSVPLVLGPSDARASWTHLCSPGALVVWREKLLYVWRQVEGDFPSVFEDLRLRGLPTSNPFDAPSVRGQFRS